MGPIQKYFCDQFRQPNGSGQQKLAGKNKTNKVVSKVPTARQLIPSPRSANVFPYVPRIVEFALVLKREATIYIIAGLFTDARVIRFRLMLFDDTRLWENTKSSKE